MKNALKTVFAVLFAALIAAVSLIPAFAAKESLKFNGTQAKVGDKVTYTLELGGCDELIEGFQMYVFFDSEKLKVVPDTLKCPEIPAAVFNDGVDGKIPVVFSSVSDKLDFSKKKTFLTVDFEVLSGGNTDITYFITELYGEDMTFLKKFEFTNTIEVDGKKVVKSKAPTLVKDQKTVDAYQGGFINYSDGKGDENGTDSAHQAVTGDMDNPDVTHIGEVTEAATEVTKSGSKGESGGFPQYVIWIVVGVIALGVGALIVVRTISGSKDK